MTTAFQSNAFQNNAFQIDDAPTQLVGGGFLKNYDSYYAERDLSVKQAALAEVNKEILLNEKEEKPLVKKAKRNTEAAIKLAALQDEINALRMERVRLMRMIDDEEAIVALLMSQPFH